MDYVVCKNVQQWTSSDKTENTKYKKNQTHNYKIRESRRHNKTNKRQIKSAFKNVEKGENKSKRYNSKIIF